MNKLTHVLLVAMVSLLAACSVEKETGDPSGMGGKDPQEVRQEVLLTFKNKLAIAQATTKAGDTPLATVAENAVTALDVYVFASDSENGNYTFQERFAYRENDAELPAGSKELTLEAGSKENEFTALLSLQKGLFVKLYCIANQPLPVDPANEGNPVTDTYFQPLVQTIPGQAGSRVATEGVPSESLFRSFHTPLLKETAAADTLVCPLPMAGAYSLPLDLTDYSVSSRMQIGFKLTRAVARFDLVNQASVSNFTIESISLGKGRRGSSFFPIQVYGTQPEAASGELITYPFRIFYGGKANAGVQTGAFYSYGSPSQDHGYLILKGKYRINRTEEKEVRYEVPFNQTDGHGNGAYLDIEPNHRYIVAITAADEYRLQTSITLADWQEGESVDDYTPENSAGEIIVSIPTEFSGDTEYKADSRTVSMSLKPGSKFSVSVDASVALAVSKTYIGGLAAKQYDWLEISELVITNQAGTTKSAPTNYGYTFSLKENYTLGRYPRATIRFTNLADGTESFFFVEAVAAPQVVEIPKTPSDTNPNSLNVDSLTASLYRITGSQVQVKIACPDGIEVESQPDWLDVEIDSQTGAETVYRLTLNNRDVSGVPDNKGIVTFRNTKVNELKTDITVRLLDAGILPSFAGMGGTGNTYTPGSGNVPDNVEMTVSDQNQFSVSTTSMTGIQVETEFNGFPCWLLHDGETYVASATTATAAAPKAGSLVKRITFRLDNSRLVGAQPVTVTFKNKIGGKDYAFTVTPKFLSPVLSAGTQPAVPAENAYNAASKHLTFYTTPKSGSNSTLNVQVTAFGGSKLRNLPAWLTASQPEYTAGTTGSYTFTVNKNNLPATVPTVSNNLLDAAQVQVCNTSDTASFEEVTMQLLSSDLFVNGTPSGTNFVSWNAATKTAVLTVKDGSKLNFPVKSVAGFSPAVNFNGGSSWLTYSASQYGANAQTVVFTVNKNAMYNARQVTVTLTNALTGGLDYVFYIKPQFATPVVTETSYTANGLSGDLITMQHASWEPNSHSTITLQAVSPGGSKIEVSNGLKVTTAANSTAETASYTVEVLYNTTQTKGTVTISNYTDASVKKVLNVTITASQMLYPKTNEPAVEFGTYWIAASYEPVCTWDVAQTVCPSGWTPITNEAGMYFYKNWNGVLDKLFTVYVPGQSTYEDGAVFWTTASTNSIGVCLSKAYIAKCINANNLYINYVTTWNKTRSFPVRCIRSK